MSLVGADARRALETGTGGAMTTVDTAVTQQDLEERLKFETLIADLSTRFVNVAADHVDLEIRHAQQRIVEALDLDRSALW